MRRIIRPAASLQVHGNSDVAYQKGRMGENKSTESSGRYLGVWRRQPDGE